MKGPLKNFFILLAHISLQGPIYLESPGLILYMSQCSSFYSPPSPSHCQVLVGYAQIILYANLSNLDMVYVHEWFKQLILFGSIIFLKYLDARKECVNIWKNILVFWSLQQIKYEPWFVIFDYYKKMWNPGNDEIVYEYIKYMVWI